MQLGIDILYSFDSEKFIAEYQSEVPIDYSCHPSHDGSQAYAEHYNFRWKKIFLFFFFFGYWIFFIPFFFSSFCFNFTDPKVRTILYSIMSNITGKSSTALRLLLFLFSNSRDDRILSTGPKVRTTSSSIINSTTRKPCSKWLSIYMWYNDDTIWFHPYSRTLDKTREDGHIWYSFVKVPIEITVLKNFQGNGQSDRVNRTFCS